MFVRIRTGAYLALIALASTAASAADTGGNFSVGVTAGALGFGPELGFRPLRYFGLRVDGGFFSYNHDEAVNDIDYSGKLKLDSIGLTADLYPFGGGFRLSVGARHNDNKIALTGTPTMPVTIGNNVYTPAEIGTLSGNVSGNNFAPTFSLGYGGKLAKGLTLGVDLGVMFQGSPHVKDLHGTGYLASNDPAFQSDIQAEEQSIDKKVHSFQYWPIAQLALLYRF